LTKPFLSPTNTSQGVFMPTGKEKGHIFYHLTAQFYHLTHFDGGEPLNLKK